MRKWPFLLVMLPATAGTLTVTWDPETTAVQYVIERRPGFPPGLVNPEYQVMTELGPGVSAWRDASPELTPGSLWCYRVLTVIASGARVASPEFCAAVPEPPEVPTRLRLPTPPKNVKVRP